MAPELFSLKLAFVLTASAAVFFCVFAVQRIYYWLRTRRVAEVETSHFHLWRDGPAFAAAVGLVLCTIGLWQTLNTLNVPPREIAAFYRGLRAGEDIKEFDVTTADGRGLTVMLYPASISGIESGETEQSLATPGTSFRVTTEIVDFNPLLRLLGQPRLVRVLAVSGDGAIADADGNISAESRPRSVEFEKPGELPFLSRMIACSTRRVEVVSPPKLAAGTRYVLRLDDKGELALVEVKVEKK